MASSPAHEAFRLITSHLLTPEDWGRPVVDRETIFPSVTALKETYAVTNTLPPAFVYGTRTLAPVHSAEHILDALFPHGVPEIDQFPKETARNLQMLIRMAERVAASPGMEEVVEDPSIIIILDEERFLQRIENSLGLPMADQASQDPANENQEG